MNESYEGEVHVLERNLWFPLVCLALVGVGVLSPASEAAAFLWFVAFWAAVSGSLVAIRNAFRRKVRQRVVATRGLLELGARSIPTSHIAEAKLLPRRHGAHGDAEVALVLRDRTRVAMTTSTENARQILRALGVADGERRATFALVPSFAKRFGLAYVAVALCYGPLFASTRIPRAPQLVEWLFFLGLLAVFGITPLAMIVGLVLGVLKGKLVIGADGFTLRWFRTRFVRFADVVAIEYAGGRDTLVTLRSKKRLRLRAHDTPDTEEQKGAEASALYDHLRTASALAAQLRAEGDLAGNLQRQQRSAKDWLRGLDVIVSGAASGYRNGAVTAEMLHAVVRSSNGAPDLRVGAAAALVRIAPDEREKVRIAAEACAETETRRALLDLADAEDDEAFERALASVNKR